MILTGEGLFWAVRVYVDSEFPEPLREDLTWEKMQDTRSPPEISGNEGYSALVPTIPLISNPHSLPTIQLTSPEGKFKQQVDRAPDTENGGRKSEEFLFPLAPQSARGSPPPRKYSPPPHIPKKRTESISSLLPAFPTPAPSPPPQETLRDKMIEAARGALHNNERDTSALLPISVPGSIRNEARGAAIDFASFNANKGRAGASTSVSTLGIRGDEQENISGPVIEDLHSNLASESGSDSSDSMTTGVGGYKEVPWRRRNTGSPGPSELMNLDHQDIGLRAAVASSFGNATAVHEEDVRGKSGNIATTTSPSWWEEEGDSKVTDLAVRQGKKAEIVIKLPPPPAAVVTRRQTQA